MGRVRSF